MSLQRRLLVYLLLCAPLVWAGGLLVTARQMRHEVNEMFDTGIIRMADQLQALLAGAGTPGESKPPSSGEADLREFAVAIWDDQGRRLLTDREGARLPRLPEAAGFVGLTLEGQPWRVFYLQSPHGEWLIATGQLENERDEVVEDLVIGQLAPWLAALPVLLIAMAWAVRQALAPLRALAAELRARDADQLGPLPLGRAPVELRPLLAAANGLFARIAAARERERRFTADAAHELRTPLAALRAHWDVLRAAGDAEQRRHAEQQIGVGLARMDRLVSQMLALARLEGTEQLPRRVAIAWPTLVEQAMSDVLALAERRGIELGCDWPADGAPPFPLEGDPDLVAVLLRNLLDNAVRYAPERSVVALRFTSGSLAVENPGPPLTDETRSRLGERFHRDEGQAENGSGLGISIARRIAALHGLELHHRARADGSGMVAELVAPAAGRRPSSTDRHA